MTNKIRNKLNFQFVIKQLLLPFNNINYKTTILWHYNAREKYDHILFKCL